MMKIYLFFVLAAAGLIAQPALANYPCPGGPGPGEQQIGVGGGSHGVAAVPLCVATGGGSDAGGVYSAGGGYVGGYRCDGCNIFADPGPPSYDAMSIAINEQAARNVELQKLMQEAEANLQKLEADPEYQRYKQGEWKIFQGKKDSAPGDNCVAMWSKEAGAVSIVGPGKAYQGGMLIFWSADIPRPSDTQTVAVTLKQSKYQAQSVNALNFSVPNIPAGAIGLTVPNIEAALNTMLDVEHFIVEMGGRAVADIDWTDGLAARAKLNQCVSNR
ncbi:hypothetical protein ACOCLD_00885 [Pseudomonas sp. MAC6]|uniref:hypothetical protein n=1 Tax=Pseudomonas sp. MAC6 TaxID=3401633 RepID=UPI003BF51C3E